MQMECFRRKWNVFGVREPLLFPIKRAGQPKIHLACLLREFFEFEEGKCTFKTTILDDVEMKWYKNGIAPPTETWTLSEGTGNSTPKQARFRGHFSLNDTDLVKSLREMMKKYSKVSCTVDLGKIIGIGGEGTVLLHQSGRLN